MRAQGMGYVDEARFRSLYEVMRRKGWLKVEPGDDRTAPEKPRLMEDLARSLGLRPEASELVFRYDFSLSDAEDVFGVSDAGLPLERQRSRPRECPRAGSITGGYTATRLKAKGFGTLAAYAGPSAPRWPIRSGGSEGGLFILEAVQHERICF